MNTIKKVAVYPIFSDTLPIARYLMQYCSDIEVVELLSPLGSCACGKDASVLDNREALGKQIHPYVEADFRAWDYLYLLQHETLGLTEKENSQKLFLPLLNIAQKKGRKVISCLPTPKSLADYRSETDMSDTTRESVIKKSGMLKQIKTFLVFVGGVITEANALEIMLKLYGELKKDYRVAAFSSSPNAEICGVSSLYHLISNRSYTEEQKVFEIENVIYTKSKAKKADIILLQLDEALLPFSDTQTNGFGLVPFMVSQLISPDYCICCLPYGYANRSVIDEFALGIEGRLGFAPDYWHLSNALLDFTTLTSVRDAGAIHTSIKEVEKAVAKVRSQGVNIGCAVLPDYLRELAQDIALTLHENLSVRSIL